jgi:hypothetical protein
LVSSVRPDETAVSLRKSPLLAQKAREKWGTPILGFSQKVNLEKWNIRGQGCPRHTCVLVVLAEPRESLFVQGAFFENWQS